MTNRQIGVLKAKANSFTKNIGKTVSASFKFAKGCIYKDYYGQLLIKNGVSVVAYSLLYLTLLGLLVFDPFNAKSSLTYAEFSQRAIEITTALIALLIPIAISLIDDSRVNIMRPVIVKDIVRLQWLTGITFFIFFYCLLPNHGGIKLALTPLVVLSWLFFLFSFYRSYLWLNDLTPPDLNMRRDGKDPPGWGGKSYKFARTVKALLETDDERAWETVWGQKQPADFEDQLHSYFISKVKAELAKNTKKSLELSGLLLAIYNAGFDNRNTNNWRLFGVYVEGFLEIYAQIISVQATKRDGSIWQGKDACERLFAKLWPLGLETGQDYELFRAMAEYCKTRKLDSKLGKKDDVRGDTVVPQFLEAFFDAVYEDKLFPADMNFKDHPEWQVTYDNLYEQRINLSFLSERTYKNWLFKKLEGKGEELYRADRVTSMVFPDSDPITISRLYWFLFKAQNTADSKLALKLYLDDPSPIGYIGHMAEAWSTPSQTEKQMLERHSQYMETQENAATKLFAHMYPQYLRMWNVEELVKTAKAMLSKKLDERETASLKKLSRLLEKINEMYKAES